MSGIHKFHCSRLTCITCIQCLAFLSVQLCMWGQIEKTMDDWEPRKLLDGMLSEVRESTHGLHTLITNVDLAKDARHLRYV